MAAEEASFFEGFVGLRCLCGRLHTMLRDQVVDGLGVTRWKCAGCHRRFIVACTPAEEGAPETYWPVFLDGVPPTGETREEGISFEDPPAEPGPPEIHFQCRCGCKLVGKSPMYGRPTRCPRCGARIVLNVGYGPEDGRPVPLLEFPSDRPKA
jgi:DNA-directed RNA polymerase subunit RPC12/RpoP